MIAYLFSPIFYPIISINPFNLILICENFLLIIIFYYLFKNFGNNFTLIKLFYLLSLLLLLFIVSETTTNIGIVIRQKWTILVFFIYILVDGQKKNYRKIIISTSSFISVEAFLLRLLKRFQIILKFL